jgi:hypothetical protein
LEFDDVIGARFVASHLPGKYHSELIARTPRAEDSKIAKRLPQELLATLRISFLQRRERGTLICTNLLLAFISGD